MGEQWAEIIDRMTERLDHIKRGLKEEGVSTSEQKHLDKGTVERAYWHAGYAAALADLLHILQNNKRNAA
jgi:hypothetical protein